MSPVDRAGTVTGRNFTLGSYEKFQLGFRDEKRPKILGTRSGTNYETKQTSWNTKKLTFMPIIASATPKAVSLQLNGMLMMWKIQQVMQDNAIQTTRIHPTFIPVIGIKCSYGKISSPCTDILGTKTVPHLIWTNGKFHKGFRGKARSRKLVSGEEDLSQ